MQDVRPLEHRQQLGDERRVAYTDRALLERQVRRTPEHAPGDMGVSRPVESRPGGRSRVPAGTPPQTGSGWMATDERLVQNGMPVVERAQQPFSARVSIAE